MEGKHHYLCFFCYVNVFLSPRYLHYLQVLIQNKALWCRLQAAKSSAGSGTFPGLSEHEKRLEDWFYNGICAWPNWRQGHYPLCKDQAELE